MISQDELEAFREGLRRAVATSSGSALEAALEGIGWRDALTADRRAAVSVLFELLGRADAASSALDLVFADALGAAAGTAAVVLPALGSSVAPGLLEGDTLGVEGSGSAALAGRDDARALVVARSGAKHVTLTVDTAGLGLRAIRGLDPGTGLVEVRGRVRAEGATELGPRAWDEALSVGRLALSHQLVGASRAMLELASDHARERVQFGRPIAAFQAVRHRLAESLVAIEAADAALASAWEEGSALGAALAKAIAGRSARTVAGHAQQVLAGMGFTTEHPFHRYLRRTILLDQLLGDSRSLFRAVGKDLVETRELPSLLPL